MKTQARANPAPLNPEGWTKTRSGFWREIDILRISVPLTPASLVEIDAFGRLRIDGELVDATWT